MKQIVTKTMILLVTLFCCIGCAQIYDSFSRLNLLSDADEVELGEQVKTEIESKEKVSQDQELTRYINGIGQRVAPYLPQRSFGYDFKVLESDVINAFATPGGHCYVYTGLIKFADNEAELAGVIAHECSHVAAEHIGRQLTTQYTYNLLISAALGKDPSVGTQIATSLAGAGLGLSYSRSHEFEADRLGAEAMYGAGYHPRGMIDFFYKLDKEHESNPKIGKITKYLSTHPPTPERIKALEAQIATFDLSQPLIMNTQEFERIKGMLK